METLDIGIIGCGVIAPVHIDSYTGLEGVRVRAICDPKSERLADMDSRYPDMEWSRYQSADELFQDDSINAVSVCTDHASHEKLVIQSLNAGKHVLCEKPLGISLEAIGRMRAASESSGRVAAGVFQHRFDPVFRVLKTLIEEGALGRILTSVGNHSCHRTHAYYANSDWRGTLSGEGGSLLINQSIHFLDIIQWLNGGVQTVTALTGNLGHEGIIETEDTASLSMALGNGAIGSFTATSASHQTWSWSLHVAGTEGAVHLENGQLANCHHKAPEQAEAIRNRLTHLDEIKGVAGAKDYYGSSHPAQIADFVNAIRNGNQPHVTLADASTAVELVLAAYRSSQEGRMQAL